MLQRKTLFCGNPKAEAGWVITQYHAKDPVEHDFKLLKDPGLIRWRPCRHWTDTKIRAFGFCGIMALALVRVMEIKAARANLKMSPAVLNRELDDLREIVMVEDEHNARTEISARSTVQQQLYDLFKLGNVESMLIRRQLDSYPQQNQPLPNTNKPALENSGSTPPDPNAGCSRNDGGLTGRCGLNNRTNPSTSLWDPGGN